MMIMACGIALVMAPATETIKGSLTRAKAGVGSAMNDTTRQVGGALGVAVVGSVMSATYGAHIADSVASSGLNAQPSVVDQAKESLGQAFQIAANAPANIGAAIRTSANEAFVAGMHRGVLVAAAAAFIGFLVVVIWLPARAADHDVFEAQDAEEAKLEKQAAVADAISVGD
jgi:hypothetical protein